MNFGESSSPSPVQQNPEETTQVPTEVPIELLTEEPIELPVEVPAEIPTEVATESSTEATIEVSTETQEPLPPPEPEQSVIPTDLGKEPYDSVGIWAIPPEYLEFSLGEMAIEKVDDFFSKDSCFFEEPDPLKNNLHIVFNEQDNVATTKDDSTCWFAMDKTDTGLPENFFSTPIMRIIIYSEIDPVIPIQTGNQYLTTASMFVARMNCSIDPDSSYYSTTKFFIGDVRSYYRNEAGLTYIGPEHSSSETKKKAFVLIVDLRPQSLGYDENGREQQRTPVYLYEYVFPDAEDPKDPIEIIHDALKKSANPGTPTDGTLNQELAEEFGKKIFFSCRLNKANPGFAVGGKDIENIEGIRINVKLRYLIFETQYSIEHNLFEKHYNSLH
jgi:hypothetical protein